MSRISRNDVVQAVLAFEALTPQAAEKLADEIYRGQPNLLASILVLSRMGIHLQKVQFAVEMLYVCFLAMRNSGLSWPKITEDEQDRQLTQLVSSIRLGEGLNPQLQDYAIKIFIDAHPEKELMAWVWTKTAEWLQAVDADESDKHVMLAVLNLVQCIAYVPMPRQGGRRRRQT